MSARRPTRPRLAPSAAVRMLIANCSSSFVTTAVLPGLSELRVGVPRRGLVRERQLSRTQRSPAEVTARQTARPALAATLGWRGTVGALPGCGLVVVGRPLTTTSG